jgi:ABC-type Co2+ transport system permease subunit
MGVYHAAIGIIEGVITVVAIKLIISAKPDLQATVIRGAAA